VVVTGGEVIDHYTHDSAGHIDPGPDGKVLYTARGLWTAEAKRIGDARDAAYTLPATQPDLYMSLRLADGFGRRGTDKSVLSVYLAGSDQPLASLPEVELPTGINLWDREPFGFDKHILLNPAAKRLVVIPETNDKVVLYRFDLVDLLQKSGVDYLVVTSQPVTVAVKGSEYSYQVEAKSSKGGVRYRLDSGPDGMQVSKDGLVTWKVPADYAGASADVIVNVSDAAGQERFHTFTISASNK
jgi:hypothetical protein